MNTIRLLLNTAALITCCFYLNVYAAPPSHAKGAHGKGKPSKLFPSKTRNTFPATRPPGLKKNPYGLMKQGKVPRGWRKGIKKGWRCSRASNATRPSTTCLDMKNRKRTCYQINKVWFCQ